MSRNYGIKNEIGKRYKKLLVIKRAINIYNNKLAYWLCECDCGNNVSVSGASLRRGNTTSCGCIKASTGRITGHKNRKHGHCTNGKPDQQYRLWQTAKKRATSSKFEFDLTPDDIVIPEFCPILKTKLTRGSNTNFYNSASIDRFDNNLGYTKSNTWVISVRANMWKNNFSLDQLKSMVYALETEKLRRESDGSLDKGRTTTNADNS